jgi:putative membrane protein
MKSYIIPLVLSAAFGLSACETSASDVPAQTDAMAPSPADLNDLEIAHAAYTADNIDIRYAKIALKRSSNPDIRAFAQTMIRDHVAVNKLALALLDKLGASAQDNFLSQKLNADADQIAAKLESLSSAAFDRYYATNELNYHMAVNDLIEHSFIPNIENAEVKDLFEAGLGIFKGHQEHARIMTQKLGK